MKELSFKEIRKQYNKKEKKWLHADDQHLMRRLAGFQIAERDGSYYVVVQDKEQECEKIIEILQLQKKSFKRKEYMEKV